VAEAAVRPHASGAEAAVAPHAPVAGAAGQRAPAREAGAVAARLSPAAEVVASPPPAAGSDAPAPEERVAVHATERRSRAERAVPHAPAALAPVARVAALELPLAACAPLEAVQHSAIRPARERAVGPHQRVLRAARLHWGCWPRVPATCAPRQAGCSRERQDAPAV
jgi:hypothetical protein